MSQTRRLAAILAADVAGYSRLIEADEEGTLGRLEALRGDLIDPKIADHKGRIVKTTGDGLLVEFASVVEAVASALADEVTYCARANSRRYCVCWHWRAGVGLWSRKIAASERLVSAPWK
jgi:class 3 adenylate cyclase